MPHSCITKRDDVVLEEGYYQKAQIFFNYLPLRNIGLGIADHLKFVFLSYYVMYLKICFPSLWRKKCKIHYREIIVHFKYDVKIRTLTRNLLAHALR